MMCEDNVFSITNGDNEIYRVVVFIHAHCVARSSLNMFRLNVRFSNKGLLARGLCKDLKLALAV